MAFISKKKILISLGLFSCLLFSHSALAANLGDAFKVDDSNSTDPLDSASAKAGFNTSGGSSAVTVESIINTALTAIFGLLGVVFVCLIIYGGILWMNAGGNDTQVTKAKDIISQSLIGLGIVVAASAITYFIFSTDLFFNTTMTKIQGKQM